MKIKIISGGQTGADRGGLEGAFTYMTSQARIPKLKVTTGGFAPKGFRTETGDDTDLGEIFGLKEINTRNYASRTRVNITVSDFNIIFKGLDSPGTETTINFCERIGKPYLVIKPGEELASFDLDHLYKAIVLKLRHHKKDTYTINVAGHRESKFPGIQQYVHDFIAELLIKLERNEA